MRLKLLLLVLLLPLACVLQSNPTTEQVYAHFASAGLGVSNIRPTTANCKISPCLCESTYFDWDGKGGQLLVCESAQDRDRMVDYFTGLGEVSKLFKSRLVVKDLVIIQFGWSQVSQEEAERFEKALE